jgi:hypothetical protein
MIIKFKTAYVVNLNVVTVNTVDVFLLVTTCPALGMFCIMQNQKELQRFIKINYGGHMKNITLQANDVTNTVHHY